MKKSIFCLILSLLFCSLSYAGITFDNASSGGDRLTCGTGDVLTENGAVTIMVDFNATGLGTSNSARFVQRGTAGTGLLFQASNAVQFFNTGGTNLVRNSGTSFVSTGVRHILFMTWDGSTTAANVHFYLNGTEEDSYGTTTNGVTPTDNAGTTLLIGNRHDFTRTFDGTIYRVAIWDAVLTTSEMDQIRLSENALMPLQIKKTNLQRYWLLTDEPDGTSGEADTFLDYSGNGGSCTGDDGTNNTGLTSVSNVVVSYP